MRIRLLLIAAAAGLLAVCFSGRTASAGTGDWQWPREGPLAGPLAGPPTVSRGFDPPPLPWKPGHRGVDLRARPGDPVYAAGAGVIGYAGQLAGRGVVSVHHADGLETTYEPLTVSVHAGDRVERGQLIGHVGAGHGSCGIGAVCLHWGLRRGSAYLDPLLLVRDVRVRLLPIWDAARGGVIGGTAHATDQASEEESSGPPAPSKSEQPTPARSPGRSPPAVLVPAALAVTGAGAAMLRRRLRRRSVFDR